MTVLKRKPDFPLVPFYDYLPALPRTHDELSADLAAFLTCPGKAFNHGRLTWRNIAFPGANCRPDVFSICATLIKDRWAPVTFEVKATRKDYLDDINKGKWKAYRAFSSRVVFACHEGVINIGDLPPGTGLIVRTPMGWHWIRQGRQRKSWEITDRQWMNLCLKGRDASPRELRDVVYGRAAQ